VPCYYEFNGGRFPQDNRAITKDQLLALLRGAVIAADQAHNRWYGQVLGKGLRLLAVAGGWLGGRSRARLAVCLPCTGS
jgi:hypothetical protein